MITSIVTFLTLAAFGYITYLSRKEMWKQIDEIDNDMFNIEQKVENIERTLEARFADAHGDMPNLPPEMIANASNPLPANIIAAE